MTLVWPDHIHMHICIIEPLLTFFNNSIFGTGRGAVGQSCQTTRWWGSVMISCSRERWCFQSSSCDCDQWLVINSIRFVHKCHPYVCNWLDGNNLAAILPAQKTNRFTRSSPHHHPEDASKAQHSPLHPNVDVPHHRSFFASLSPACQNLVSSQR